MTPDLLEEGKRRRERKRRMEADAKAREEIRNAARTALAENGFTKDALKGQIRDLAQHAVAQKLASKDMQQMLTDLVRKEVDRQLDKLGVGLETVVREGIKAAAAEYAKQRIENAINITIKDHW